MDTTALRGAYRNFLTVAETGGFVAPPSGEWTAEQLLAHIIAADTGITAIALAVASGQRPTYDNRYSLDEWNLARIINEAGDLPSLIDLARERGRLLCDVAEQLAAAELDVGVHCLILCGSQLMADATQPLGQLINGVAEIHLPRHASQLAALHATAD